ncbi:twin-arginine translocation pathway signal [Reticulomyxa filosa]|uniref:Twin-arginine translocation pathway signal n=1 Tax=Reticulomyxa filosa TaxID=46433 RepID=X6MWP7_RETFI|nr:twin-arginine translocation pathway signal [Reticulomyxa filosa]|eukprot:ETO18264.1 twin-arginine translocation pathway signal [Reticulomyxa filosa]
MNNLHYLDLAIVIAYFIVCLLLGLHKASQVKNLRQFATGYKNITVSLLVCTIFASSIGAGSVIGASKELYLFGIIFVIRYLFVPIGWLITAKIFSKNIERFHDCLSISEIMYKLYGNWGRWITNLSSVITSIGMVAAQALALGFAFNYFLGIDKLYGMLVGYSVLSIYSAFGGIRAVIITEILKFSIFFLIIPISYTIAIKDFGGLMKVLELLPPSHTNIEINTDTILMLVSLVFYSILPEFEAPYIQRYLVAKNSKQLSQSLKTVALISFPFVLSICLIAYIVRAEAPGIPPQEVFLFFVANLLPVGLKGFMIAGLFAIIMSNAEAKLSAISVIIVNDVINVWFKNLTDRTQLLMLRLTIFIITAASIIIAYIYQDIIGLILLASNFYVPILLVPIAAGFFGFKFSQKSFIMSFALASITTIIVKILLGEFSVLSLISGIIGSFFGLFGTNMLGSFRYSPQFKVSKKSFKIHII